MATQEIGEVVKPLVTRLATVAGSSEADARIAARLAEEEARKAKAEEDRRVQNLARMTERAGGDRYAGYRFENYVSKTPHQTKVVAMVREWAETVQERVANCESLVLYGKVGTGKDHLAYAAARLAIVRFGVTVGWRNGRSLAGEFRDAIDSEKGPTEAELVRNLKAADVLVLSDPLPVTGELTPYQVDILYRVLDARYSANRPMIVTLNAIDENDADRRLGPPLWDRIQDRAWIAHCNWEGHRKPGRVLK